MFHQALNKKRYYIPPEIRALPPNSFKPQFKKIQKYWNFR